MPPIEEILDPDGYDGFVRIPPNPFILNEEDYWVFEMFMDDIEIPEKETDKALKQVLEEVWRRINNIKIWLGMTKFTRYKGEKDSSRRLVNEINIFIKYPRHCDVIYRVMFDTPPERPAKFDEASDRIYDGQCLDYANRLREFQNLLLDRDVSGIKSCRIYK